MKRVLVALSVLCLLPAVAAADYIDLPVKWSQVPYDAEAGTLPISSCMFPEYPSVWADDFICDSPDPIVAVRWWGLYTNDAGADPRPTGYVDAHISFHLSQGDHPTSVPVDQPIVIYDVRAQQEAVDYSDGWGTYIYRYDAYLPQPFEQLLYSIISPNPGELFIDICVPVEETWCWMPMAWTTDPILDWAAWSRGHVGPWESREGFNLAFELMTVPEPATMSLVAAGGLMLLRRRRRA